MTCRPSINARGHWHLEGQFILNHWCLVVSHLSQIFVPASPLCCKYLLGNLSDNAIKDLFSLLSAPHHCWWPHRWLDLESPREILQPVVRICSMSGAQWPCVGPLVKRYITYKVNRCLARYSPRATTTNQPTNQKGTKWADNAWPEMTKNDNFESKSFGTTT